MMKGAIDDLMARLEAVGVPRLSYTLDTGRGNGANRLSFRAADDWDATARTAMAWLFQLAREDKLPVGAEQPAVAVLLRHFAVTCSCGQVVGFPTSCPQCSRRIK